MRDQLDFYFDNLRKLDRVFDSFAVKPNVICSENECFSSSTWIPSIDIVEKKDEIIVFAELPGMKEQDIKLLLEAGRLTLSGKKSNQSDKGKNSLIRSEISYGEFSRSFALPEKVDQEKVYAKYADGVLAVHMPLKEKQSPEEVEVPIN